MSASEQRPRHAAGPSGTVAPPSGERLFRRRALERYAHRDEESVLPRLARPPAFAALWLLVALPAILAGVVGALPVAAERIVPLVITAEGPRLVLPGRAASTEETVSSGDPVRFVLAGASVKGRVGAVGRVKSPAELNAQLGAGLVLDGPRRLAAIDGLVLDPATARGAVVEARVTVDRPRAVTLLPGVGPWVARWIDERDHGRRASP